MSLAVEKKNEIITYQWLKWSLWE